MKSKDEIRSDLRAFVVENFLYARPDFELRDDHSLLGERILDSMGVMEMIAFLEDYFAVVVADDDITEENLGSLNAIAQYVLTQWAAGERQSA